MPKPNHIFNMQPIKNSNAKIIIVPNSICAIIDIFGVYSLINPIMSPHNPPKINIEGKLYPLYIISIKKYSNPNMLNIKISLNIFFCKFNIDHQNLALILSFSYIDFYGLLHFNKRSHISIYFHR